MSSLVFKWGSKHENMVESYFCDAEMAFFTLFATTITKEYRDNKSPQTKIWGKTNDRAIHYP